MPGWAKALIKKNRLRRNRAAGGWSYCRRSLLVVTQQDALIARGKLR